MTEEETTEKKPYHRATEIEGLAKVRDGSKEDIIFSTGLWKGVTKNKEVACLKGQLRNYFLTVFNSGEKTKESAPDATMFMSPKKDPDGNAIVITANEAEESFRVSLWINTSKSGNTYFGGKYGGYYFMIFPVKKKYSPKGPDFNLMVKIDKPKVRESRETIPVEKLDSVKATVGFDEFRKATEVEFDPYEDDDIPF